MELTTSKEPPSKTCLITNLLIGELSNFIDRSKRFISGNHLQYVAQNEYDVPDSETCMDALKLVRRCSPDYLLNHCLRSYAFGVSMAHKVDQPFDKGVLFLGSIMHDLGLTEPFDGSKTFEVEGAEAARDFCLDHNINREKSDLVHEMIALHTSVGIAHKREPEIALLHFGAGADVLGLWINDIHPKTLEEVIAKFPRLNFKKGISKLISGQIERKPKSYMATLVNLGFFDKVQDAPFDS